MAKDIPMIHKNKGFDILESNFGPSRTLLEQANNNNNWQCNFCSFSSSERFATMQ